MLLSLSPLSLPFPLHSLPSLLPSIPSSSPLPLLSSLSLPPFLSFPFSLLSLPSPPSPLPNRSHLQVPVLWVAVVYHEAAPLHILTVNTPFFPSLLSSFSSSSSFSSPLALFPLSSYLLISSYLPPPSPPPPPPPPPSPSLSSRDNLILDSIVGLIIVALSLLAFISLVWFKDQLTTGGGGPQWLARDQQLAHQQRHEEEQQRMEIALRQQADMGRRVRERHYAPERQTLNKQLNDYQQQLQNSLLALEVIATNKLDAEMMDLRIKELRLSYDLERPLLRYQALLGRARTKHGEAIERWRRKIIEQTLISQRKDPAMGGMPKEAVFAIQATPLPTPREFGESPIISPPLPPPSFLLLHLHSSLSNPPSFSFLVFLLSFPSFRPPLLFHLIPLLFLFSFIFFSSPSLPPPPLNLQD